MDSADELDALFGGGGQQAPASLLGEVRRCADYSSTREALLVKLPGFLTVGAEALPDMDARDEASLVRASATIASTKEGTTNARMVQWSDGTWSLCVGREVFQATVQQTTAGEHLHVVAGASDRAVVRSRISGRMAVSAYMLGDGSHRRLLASAGAIPESIVDSRVRITPTAGDPEREMAALVKIEQEKARQQRKEEARRRQQAQRDYAAVARDGLSARFLEEDDEEGEPAERAEDEYDSDFIDDSEQVQAGDASSSASETEERHPPRRRTMIVDDDE